MTRTALVTGANSGVGLATCLHLAKMGFRVVGTVRSDEKLETLAKAAGDAGVEVEGSLLDVTDPQGCESLVQEIEPWAVVNNAGYMNLGLVADVPPQDALRQLDAMVVAPMRLAVLALPSMRRRGEGRIVNVSSIAAHATAAMTGWYNASKHALSAVSDALRREVAGSGVQVVLIEPGGLRTGIWATAEKELLHRRDGSASPLPYDRALAILRRLQPLMPGPELAAEAIGEALTAGRPRHRYRVGRDAAVIGPLNLLLPERVKDRLARTALGG